MRNKLLKNINDKLHSLIFFLLLQRQAGRERDRNDDDWSQNPDLNSEDDPSEIVRYVLPYII